MGRSEWLRADVEHFYMGLLYLVEAYVEMLQFLRHCLRIIDNSGKRNMSNGTCATLPKPATITTDNQIIDDEAVCMQSGRVAASHPFRPL